MSTVLTPPVEGVPFRLVTLNTWKCDGAYALRLQAMAHQLRLLAPDVVALQESFASLDGLHDTAAYLGQALGLHSAVAQARSKTRSCDGVYMPSQSGMAVLSRWPVLQHMALDLPVVEQDGERIALLCQLNAGPCTLTVANVHLTHLAHAHTLRQHQVQAVLNHPWLNNPQGAAVVCGDFNAPLQSEELKCFIAPAGGWVDVARSTGLHPKLTCSVEGGSGLDLDHVLSRANSPVRWVASELTLNCPDAVTGVWPSDHFAVCADGYLFS